MKHFVVICAQLLSATLPAQDVLQVGDLAALGEAVGKAQSLGMSYSVTGDVAFVCGGDVPRIDLVHGDRFHVFWAANGKLPPIRSGDKVVIQGHVGSPSPGIRKEAASPCVAYAERVLTIGTASPMRFDPISGGRIICGDFTNQAVSVRGVLSGARRDEMNPNWNWFALRTPTGKVFVATPELEHPLQELKSMADAVVLVKGIASESRRSSSFIGFHLIPAGPEGITCLSQPPSDPFLDPPLPVQSQTSQCRADPQMPKLLHRHRIQGTVLGTSPNRIFARTDIGSFCTIIPDRAIDMPRPGCRISASGFPEINPCGLDLTEALIRVDPGERSALSKGKPIRAGYLSSSDDEGTPFDRNRQGGLFTLSGLVANSRESIAYEGIVRLACGEHTVPVDINVLKDKLAEIPDAGYRLTVTGVCFGSFTSGLSTSDLPVFTGFTIYPRVPEDVVVVSRPSWWTPARLMGVILALTVLIVAILIWNRSLAVLSDRRGKRLYAEAIAHTKAEMKVEERTHLAVELHDALSQTLTGVALQIDSACLANRGGNTRVGQVLEVAKSMLSSCRKELHNCLWDLRSRTFEEKDMTEAVTRTLAPYSDGVEISVRFNVPRSLFGESQSHAILRMVRELAVNAINHGRATRLWIAGEHHDGTVSFSVRDNGCGFDPSAVPGPREGHFGLQGIRERLEKLNGSLAIHSKPDGGTKVNVRLRMSADQNAASSSPPKS